MQLKDGSGSRWAFMQKFVIPDIAEPERDYLVRWRLVQTPWFGIFLHKILMIDNDINLHDHPWNFVTWIIKGAYLEERDGKQYSWDQGSIHKMSIGSFHKISHLWRVPTWSLVFVGPRKRQWGYQTKDGWVPRSEYNWKYYNEQIHSQ